LEAAWSTGRWCEGNRLEWTSEGTGLEFDLDWKWGHQRMGTGRADLVMAKWKGSRNLAKKKARRNLVKQTVAQSVLIPMETRRVTSLSGNQLETTLVKECLGRT